MSVAVLTWSLPPEDINDAKAVDVLDSGTAVGSVDPSALNFTTAELAPGDHTFTVVVRSKAGPEFDSDPSNPAQVTVPVAVPPPVKLTAIADLAAVLA